MIYTKEQLVEAIENKQKTIIVGGKLATEIRKMKLEKKKSSKRAWAIGGLLICGLLSAPFTMGSSLAVTAAAATATTVTTGGVIAAGGAAFATCANTLVASGLTISTKELIILCGTAIAITGIISHYNVIFNNDGSVVLTMKQS